MLRSILAVLVGYVAIGLVVMVGLTVAYFAMGTEGAFEEGSFRVSKVWAAVSLAVGLVAAIGGGWICTKVARGTLPAAFLAALVLVLGLVSASRSLNAEDPGPRDGSLGNMEAMMQAVQPPWIAFSNVGVGLLGLWIGSRLARGRSVAPPVG